MVHLYLHAPPHHEDRVLRCLFSTLPELFKWFGGMLGELTVHATAAIQAGPFLGAMSKFEAKWLKIGVNLLRNGFEREGGEVFLRWYFFIRDSEIGHQIRFPKGTVLWWMGQASQSLHNDDEAKNWQLLAMLEDVRSNAGTWRTLPAYDALVNGLQVAAGTVTALGQQAEAICASGAWSPAEPESLWLKISPHKMRFTRAPLPFLKTLALHLHTRTLAPRLTRKQQGDVLEELTAYLFGTIRGFEVLGESRAPDTQNDLLVRNSHQDPAVASLGAYLLIECKNWGKQVKAPTVREIAGRLQAAGVKTGVLVSRSGISGSKVKNARTGARLANSKEFAQDGTSIIVLTDTQVRSLASGNESLVTVLLALFEDVRFDRM